METRPVIQDAIGPRAGDELEIRNQWARVAITRDKADGQPDCYVVTGDLFDLRATSKEFAKLSDALAYAWKSLAEYQKGRAD
jgi:hypothetical protein